MHYGSSLVELATSLRSSRDAVVRSEDETISSVNKSSFLLPARNGLAW